MKNTVECLEDGEYKITFSSPIEATASAILLFGLHDFKLLMSEGRIVGLISKSEVFEDFLQASDADEQAVREFRQSIAKTNCNPYGSSNRSSTTALTDH